MTEYRTFRNDDPPRILDLWIRSAETRGFGRPANTDAFEQAVFSKIYFDPLGLILAIEDGRLVGMCHGGFGCDESEQRLDKSIGVICMLLVDPACRRRGIGSELYRRGQEYLRSNGAGVLYVGALHPLNPFYLGLYGGSEAPGVLESDTDITPFLLNRGCTQADTCLVFQQYLNELSESPGARASLLRRQVKLTVEPLPPMLSWWHNCTMGLVPTLRYEMADRETDEAIGTAWAWEMEAFSNAWRAPTAGITHLHVVENRRRQAFGSLLLHCVLKHLETLQFELVEIQTMQRNTAARGLYESLGFRQVDRGHVYRVPPAAEAPASPQTG